MTSSLHFASCTYRLLFETKDSALEQQQTWISGGETSGSAGAASLGLVALALPSFAGVTGAAFLPGGVRGRLASAACKSADNNCKHANMVQVCIQTLLACIGSHTDTFQLLTVTLSCPTV